MSIKAMTWAMEQRIITAPSARHVLLCLANYAGEDGKNAFPSIPTLASDTGMSERGVRKILRELEAEGVILPGNQDIVNAYISRADRRPVNYDIQIHLTERAEHSSARENATGGTEEPNGGNQSAERGERGSGNPSYNPSKNPSLGDRQKKSSDEAVEILSGIVGEGLAKSFVQHRKELKRPLTPTAAKRMQSKLKGFSQEQAQAAISDSIEKGWLGVFPESARGAPPPPNGKKGVWTSMGFMPEE